jgi:hypothetical protein
MKLALQDSSVIVRLNPPKEKLKNNKMRDFQSIIQTFSTNKTKQGIPKSLNSNKFK